MPAPQRLLSARGNSPARLHHAGVGRGPHTTSATLRRECAPPRGPHCDDFLPARNHGAAAKVSCKCSRSNVVSASVVPLSSSHSNNLYREDPRRGSRSVAGSFESADLDQPRIHAAAMVDGTSVVELTVFQDTPQARLRTRMRCRPRLQDAR